MKTNTFNRTGVRSNEIGLFGVCIIAALATTAPVLGQDDKAKPEKAKPTALTHPQSPMLWDVGTMMEQAVQQISKRYSLSPAQEEYTRMLLKRRVGEFLDEHESEVRQLLQESFDMRTGRIKADKVTLQIWSERAMPLYEKAADAILEGNKQWGDILTEDQKRVHDGDMALMVRGFDGMKKTLGDWSEGKGRPLNPIKTPNPNKPNQNVKTGAGVSENPGPVQRVHVEDNWFSYVQMFIRTFSLDQSAKNSAEKKIYKEQFNKAKRYRQSRAAEFNRIKKRMASLGKRDFKEREKLRNQKNQMERRVYDIFIQMDKRLKKLTTAQQIANVDAEKKKNLEALYAALSGASITKKKTTTSKAEKATTKPEVTPKKSAKPEPKTEKPEATEKPAPKKVVKPEPPKAKEAKPSDKPKAKEEPKKKEDPKSGKEVAA